MKISEVTVEDNAKIELNEVWSATDLPSVGDGHEAYYPSVSFASSDIAVMGDGLGSLYIFRDWKPLFTDSSICGVKRSFTVLSSLLWTEEKFANLSVLLMYIEDKSKVENLQVKSSGNFVHVVEWVTFKLDDTDSCQLSRVKRFAFLGEIESLELDQNGILYLGEQKPFQLLYDSEGMEVDEINEENPDEKPPPFYWMQGVEDMVVWVMLPDGITKKEIKVVLKPSHLVIKLRDQTIVDGKMWSIIDSDSMTWTIDAKKQRLEITMCKAHEGMIWQRFLADSNVDDGEEVRDPVMVEKIHQQFNSNADGNANQSNQVYNVQELEACDENGQVSRIYMYIKNGGKNEVQKVNIGDNQLLFFGAQTESPEALNQHCLRHDVDGLVWQPTLVNGQLKMEHIDTFSALGYVQASKEQRRYTLVSPDRSFVAIIDRARHVYIYRKPEAISEGCELRNRKSGRQVQKVAKQQVPTLDHDPEDYVVGALATKNSLMVSTTLKLFCLKIH